MKNGSTYKIMRWQYHLSVDPVNFVKMDVQQIGVQIYTFWDITEKTFLLSCFSDIGILSKDIFLKFDNSTEQGVESFFERYIFNHQMLKIAKQLKIDNNDSLEKSFYFGMKNLTKNSLEQALNAEVMGQRRLALQYENLSQVFDDITGT